jgi:hypothetical protein
MRRLKNLIERAYREGEKLLGLSVWGTDQAGPFQTIPYPGSSWQPQGKPARQPHQHIRNGTAKLMTLFQPATGEVRVKGVRSCTNAVLHPWLEEHLTAILETLPPPQLLSPEENRAMCVAKLAGGAYGEGDAARGLATVEDVIGFGQPYRAQESGVALMDVLEGDHGALHTVGSLLVEHDRVDAADPRPQGIGRTLSGEPRRDYRMAGSDGTRMEP